MVQTTEVKKLNEFSEKRQTLVSYRNYRNKRTERKVVGERIDEVFDKGSFVEIEPMMETKNPLCFDGYEEKIRENQNITGAKDSVKCGAGTIDGIKAVGAELSKNFLMGSMGTVEGEKLTLAFEEGMKRKCPVIIFSASGGARMQEGMFSLMQMAKTSAACKRFKDKGGLYISVLTHPTTGGVSASYANLGDIILAEPKALIGFAGPRVIEQTIGEKLPEGFQRAEFQLEHGFVDRIVKRENLKSEISNLLRLNGFGKDLPCEETNKITGIEGNNFSDKLFEIESEEAKSMRDFAEFEAEKTLVGMISEVNIGDNESSEKSLEPYDRLQISRDKDRPKINDFIDALFSDFTELHGDRLGKDDKAILGGLAYFHGIPVTILGHRKGRNIKENMSFNFGMPEPEGYRKALRLMKEAEKFKRPVITFIDTPGAYPGKEAEENGQSIAIAENLAEMSTLKIPVLVIVTGEGNSGGALALSVGDRIIMLENSVYSVLSPEGFASILWKDSKRNKEACSVMKMTAKDLYDDGIIDKVIPEPDGGMQKDFDGFIKNLDREMFTELQALMAEPLDILIKKRYEKYRNIKGGI